MISEFNAAVSNNYGFGFSSEQAQGLKRPEDDDIIAFHQQLLIPFENLSLSEIAVNDFPISEVNDGPASSGFWQSDKDPSAEFVNQGAGSPFVQAPALGVPSVEHIHTPEPIDLFSYDL